MALTAEEKAYIKNNEKAIGDVLSIINAVKQFRDGDFLIAFHQATGFGDTKLRPVTNSYGAVKKFQVVAVDKHGIPYMKELNKNGKPAGQLISSIQNDSQRGMGYNYRQTYIFEVDPDYTDSIILDDQEGYDATGILKAKSDTFKEIAEHNKKIKVEANDAKLLAAFIATIKVGDLLWRSNVSSWVVVEINPLPRDKANRIENYIPFAKVTTNKGKTIPLCFHDFRGRALYTSRPRTYKELRDPK
jgi:hypothetical protein